MSEDLLNLTIRNTRQYLLSLRNGKGHWEGHLSSSALSTATAMVALHGVNAQEHGHLVNQGARWLVANQNQDGGWGDTILSKSNLSTTLLCWSALHQQGILSATCEAWIRNHVGSLEPAAIAAAVVKRYGKDKTFSVPILMLCTICGTLGEGVSAWKRVLALPFELAALPRTWFGIIGLPVVSYALPALIAIGYTRFKNAPPSRLNPLYWLRATLWERIRPMLKDLQPSSGGYLEATPLTSFVTMALAAAGEKEHPCVPEAVAFLTASIRKDGSWPIDTNLATWGTTLALKALGGEVEDDDKERLLNWLHTQQYQVVHPFTNAAPGGWAWTDLPGGVPDADDTAGALSALRNLEGVAYSPGIELAIKWLLDLQNRDGGVPTFCRGWGTLPFDRSTPELTAHALMAWWLWEAEMPEALRARVKEATRSALQYLERVQRPNGSWIPLWFGNEHTHDEDNPVYGTAQVLSYLNSHPGLAAQATELTTSGVSFLSGCQKPDGSWGGDATTVASIEETAVALNAIATAAPKSNEAALERAIAWLVNATKQGTEFPGAPIGLYFARLWYHEQLYPIVWTLQALSAAKAVLSKERDPARSGS